jgi:hypothetical protein
VIFDIDEREKPELDRADGLGNGYGEKSANVLEESGQEHRVVLYAGDSDRRRCLRFRGAKRRHLGATLGAAYASEKKRCGP